MTALFHTVLRLRVDYRSTPHISPWHCGQLIKGRENFAFYLIM
jgi:hypothetical protein